MTATIWAGAALVVAAIALYVACRGGYTVYDDDGSGGGGDGRDLSRTHGVLLAANLTLTEVVGYPAAGGLDTDGRHIVLTVRAEDTDAEKYDTVCHEVVHVALGMEEYGEAGDEEIACACAELLCEAARKYPPFARGCAAIAATREREQGGT